ncbi:ribonuclease HII [candidate division WWE3 bacterium RIFOXYC1_FULL_40_10]|uniref:Ribonuclease HII n=1 Tax=candidate division WWE3 bacterium RIFOXYA2_FULL_46_9 TaxID=1802636 RepID=A0A1F4W1X3_UNCKA|nr:MAG: ribonuclease HII [candidate division WWE3 bacterium RIFOXYB1_FULL_40_22]OGC61457.1 MAG: ribonuclease HII [candidate division WWE3 bacterium RIFOXYA1_FULL_40_11]OGC63391.1 MAG: ribonuclease HII [candidate division WWE3 bacterium RIFOXYA2_FULL_46_9]OGC64459.1 MAG: ribonuclease HII [candidate division WWE3 bacterium RIFOXYB2_FULL_41_6]OGC65840.1 MAG: ribonuclease HII [candidate division WWE3 bacterium RIFOXYC1_FULL_40_10]HLD51233.1 ribonuclease HII [Patescibacteria group bacterium]
MKQLLDFETQLFNQGKKFIAGVDEVGRGPLAGPLVVAAVVLNLESILTNNDVLSENYSKINDSKKLPEKMRINLDSFIRTNAIEFSIVEIGVEEIDRTGIGKCNLLGFKRAISRLKIALDHVLTDSFIVPSFAPEKQTNIVRGDTKSISIAAASIVAKVYRDQIMKTHDSTYPEYGFAKHKGYGTKQHIEAITRNGPCELHRKSFEPVKSFLNSQPARVI